jgi:diguanylate cyclase (GGDEF)-like protein
MLIIWSLVSLVAGALLGTALIAVAAVLSQQHPLSELFLNAFLRLGLPAEVSFEQFLVFAVIAIALVAVVVAILCGVVILGMGSLVAAARMQRGTHRSALDRAMQDLQAQVERDQARLVGLSATLTERLDKSSLMQNILQAAKQLTSLPRLDSLVALWVLDFESDRIRFARGARCDESFFTRNEFATSDGPITKLTASQQALWFDSWQAGFPYVKPDKVGMLGEATGLMLVPLIIERTLLGCLVIFCHKDVGGAFSRQRTFYNAAWGQLALALGIGIQEELAILDRLTGVVNHTYFMKRLSQEVDRSNRYQLSVSLMMVDIDNFKKVNDALGHQQGDDVLKTVARLLKQHVRAIDLVGRYGGEEFIVLLPETGLAADAGGPPGPVVVAERIRAALEQEFARFQKPLSVTVSVGVSVRRFPEDRQMDPKELIRLADEQLYKAKTSGKNKVCLAAPEPQPAAGSSSPGPA